MMSLTIMRGRVFMATIAENLFKKAALNPTQKTHSQSMETLCYEIENKNVVLPVYQTGLRWTKQKNVDLFEFMFSGKAPVAPISMNLIKDTSKAIEQVSFIDRQLITGNLVGKSSITDGQQRLTCLYKAYINDPDFEDIVFDISKGKFLVLNSKIKNYQIPVGILLNKELSVFYQYMNSNSFLKNDLTKDAVLSVRKKFLSYNFVVNWAEDLDEEEQIEWFEKLNNAGTQVSFLQMKFSKMLIKGLDIYPEYIGPYVEKIYSRDLNKLFKTKATETSFPIAALNPAYEVLTAQNSVNITCPIPSNTNESQLASLNVDQLRQVIKLTLEALDFSFEFIKQEKLRKPSRMEQLTYIMGVIIHNKSTDLDDYQREKLRKWYTSVNFSNMSNTEKRTLYKELLQDTLTSIVPQ